MWGSRRPAAIVGFVALSAGCGSGPLGITSTVAGNAVAAEQRIEPEGFDECGLLTPGEMAKTLGVPAVYVTSREVVKERDGRRRAACAYSTDNTPGVVRMIIAVVADTDPERFFAPFKKYKKVESVADLGDEAKVIGYAAKELGVHFREIRVLTGGTGLHLWYVNVPDIGAGARLFIAERETGQGPLEATVNLGDKVVKTVAVYGPRIGPFKEPRPEDLQLVRAITKAVGG